MPQALKPLSLIHIGKGKFSQLPLLALWGNKNWLPTMKVKKLEKCQNKMGFKGCKWFSLNAPGSQTPLCHPFSEPIGDKSLSYFIRRGRGSAKPPFDAPIADDAARNDFWGKYLPKPLKQIANGSHSSYRGHLQCKGSIRMKKARGSSAHSDSHLLNTILYRFTPGGLASFFGSPSSDCLGIFVTCPWPGSLTRTG